jgi:hypothetical protein
MNHAMNPTKREANRPDAVSVFSRSSNLPTFFSCQSLCLPQDNGQPYNDDYRNYRDQEGVMNYPVRSFGSSNT